jgi:hypothetical protein
MPNFSPAKVVGATLEKLQAGLNYLIDMMSKWSDTAWTSNNDGTGSGLDADTVDTKHAADFLLVGGTAVDSDKVDGWHAAELFMRQTTDISSPTSVLTQIGTWFTSNLSGSVRSFAGATYTPEGTGASAWNWQYQFFRYGNPDAVGGVVYAISPNAPLSTMYYNTMIGGAWSGWQAIWNAGNDGGLLLKAYPIGAIYISVVSTSPATLFGGTWEKFAEGRVLVGIDTTAPIDTDFDTVEETGGAKTVVSGAHTFTGDAMGTHIHNAITAGTPAGTNGGPSSITVVTGGGAATVGSGTHGHTFTGTQLGTHQHPAKTAGIPAGTVNAAATSSVVQPYVVVYMWKRTT